VFLLDTMVVSERTKTRPDPSVRAWIAALAPETQFVSALTMGEISFGVHRLPSGSQKQRLQTWFDALGPFFAGRILPVDAAAAERWARQRIALGRSVSVVDALIAATAHVRGLTVATRNERDFVDLGVRVVNPWLS
jgi:toxin FitB